MFHGELKICRILINISDAGKLFIEKETSMNVKQFMTIVDTKQYTWVNSNSRITKSISGHWNTRMVATTPWPNWFSRMAR